MLPEGAFTAAQSQEHVSKLAARLDELLPKLNITVPLDTQAIARNLWHRACNAATSKETLGEAIRVEMAQHEPLFLEPLRAAFLRSAAAVRSLLHTAHTAHAASSSHPLPPHVLQQVDDAKAYLVPQFASAVLPTVSLAQLSLAATAVTGLELALQRHAQQAIGEDLRALLGAVQALTNTNTNTNTNTPVQQQQQQQQQQQRQNLACLVAHAEAANRILERTAATGGATMTMATATTTTTTTPQAAAAAAAAMMPITTATAQTAMYALPSPQSQSPSSPQSQSPSSPLLLTPQMQVQMQMQQQQALLATLAASPLQPSSSAAAYWPSLSPGYPPPPPMM